MRKLILMAFLAALGALAISVPGAAASGVIVPPPEVSTMSLEQCTQGTMCIWSNNNWTGNFSQWPGSSTGCHNHEGIPKIKSAWNRTGYTVTMGGGPTLKSGDAMVVLAGENPITGLVCW